MCDIHVSEPCRFFSYRRRGVIFLFDGVHIVCVIPICVSDGTGCAVP